MKLPPSDSAHFRVHLLWISLKSNDWLILYRISLKPLCKCPIRRHSCCHKHEIIGRRQIQLSVDYPFNRAETAFCDLNHLTNNESDGTAICRPIEFCFRWNRRRFHCRRSERRSAPIESLRPPKCTRHWADCITAAKLNRNRLVPSSQKKRKKFPFKTKRIGERRRGKFDQHLVTRSLFFISCHVIDSTNPQRIFFFSKRRIFRYPQLGLFNFWSTDTASS